jgi:glycosyltransferase involved in cell wall biosynthesis
VRWARLLYPARPKPGVRVFYGHDEVPDPDDVATGGTAKFQRLVGRWPNHPTDFSLLYLGSTWLPRDLRPLLWIARRRRAAIVLNQNGVGYPAWAGDRAEAFNRPLRRVFEAADRVLFQSEFCRRSAELFVGTPRGEWEVLHNAVDVSRFVPAPAPEGGPVLLAAGDQTQGAYRLELALRTLAHVVRTYPDARLLVTGRVLEDPTPSIRRLGLEGRVELVGRYRQADAPAVYRRAHVLLHTQLNDSCPSVVLEAMASGVPIVYSASGGTVELVEDEAGIGVPHEESWERLLPPEPAALADAVDRVLRDLERYRQAARSRCVERFALEPWLDRHETLFSALVGA